MCGRVRCRTVGGPGAHPHGRTRTACAPERSPQVTLRARECTTLLGLHLSCYRCCDKILPGIPAGISEHRAKSVSHDRCRRWSTRRPRALASVMLYYYTTWPIPTCTLTFAYPDLLASVNDEFSVVVGCPAARRAACYGRYWRYYIVSRYWGFARSTGARVARVNGRAPRELACRRWSCAFKLVGSSFIICEQAGKQTVLRGGGSGLGL